MIKTFMIRGQALNIEIETFGDVNKKPIVFLHGGPGCNYLSFRDFFTSLQDDYFLIFYNQIGCGNSDSIKDYSVDDDVELIKQILCEYNLKGASFVGESWGTFLGMYAYTKLKDMFDNLILLSSVSLNTLKDFEDNLVSMYTSEDLDVLNGYEDEYNNGQISLTSLFEKSIAHNNKFYLYDQNNASKLIKHDKSINPVQNGIVSKFIPRLGLVENLQMLNESNVHFYQAKQDITNFEDIQNICNKIDKVSFTLVDNCGHWIYLEQTDFIVNEIRNIVK